MQPHPVPDRSGGNAFLDDPELEALLGIYMAPELLAHLRPHLCQLGEQAAGPLDELAQSATGGGSADGIGTCVGVAASVRGGADGCSGGVIAETGPRKARGALAVPRAPIIAITSSTDMPSSTSSDSPSSRRCSRYRRRRSLASTPHHNTEQIALTSEVTHGFRRMQRAGIAERRPPAVRHRARPLRHGAAP